MVKKISGYFQIIRGINFLITFASILVAGMICADNGFVNNKIIYAAIAGAFVGSAGNIINDYFDISIDIINKPNRPLPSQKISKNEALAFYFILNFSAIILSVKINIISIIIVFASIISIFFYSYKLKKIPLVGNFVVSFFTALAFVFGGAAVENISNSIFPAIFALLINMIREIVKDMEDIEGDIKSEVFTFPAKYGVLKTIILIKSLMTILILATTIPFLIKHYSIEYFIIVMMTVNIACIYLMKSIAEDQSKKNLKRMSKLLKINMIFGLLAIYVGN